MHAASEPVEARGFWLAFAAGFFFSARAVVVLIWTRALGMEPSQGSAVGIATGYLLLAAVCFHSFGSGAQSRVPLSTLPTVRWVAVFLALSGSSMAWTAAASPAASLVYWSGLVVDVATVLILLRPGPVADLSEALMRGFVASTCCLSVLAWLMPAQADLRLGDPEFFNTNQIGNLCALAILFTQYLGRLDKKNKITLLFLALTLLRSLSKTTLVAFIVCEAYLLWRDRGMSRRTKLLVVGSSCTAVLAFWGLLQAYYTVYTNAGNQAETFTGRTAVWAYALENGLEKPLLGNGFDSMWKVAPPFGNEFFEARHAENEVLQQFYAYGVAGLVVLFGLYGSFWRCVRRLPRAKPRTALLAILIYVLVRGLAEAEPFDLLLPLWMLVMLAALVDFHSAGGIPQQALKMSSDCNF